MTNARFGDDFLQYKLYTHTYTCERIYLVSTVCFSYIITIGIHKRRSCRSSPARGICEACTYSHTHTYTHINYGYCCVPICVYIYIYKGIIQNMVKNDNNNNKLCMFVEGEHHSIIFKFDRRERRVPPNYYYYY